VYSFLCIAVFIESMDSERLYVLKWRDTVLDRKLNVDLFEAMLCYAKHISPPIFLFKTAVQPT